MLSVAVDGLRKATVRQWVAILFARGAGQKLIFERARRRGQDRVADVQTASFNEGHFDSYVS